MTTTQHGTSLEHRVGPRGRFTLLVASGEIAVRGVEGDTIRVRALDDRPLDDMFDVGLADDGVTLRQVEGLPLGRRLFSHRGGAELAVEVPHGATVSVETASADVEASDLSGAKSFRTASGELTLRRLAGPVDVETVSGEIELEGQAPVDLRAKSVSGDISVRVPTVRRLDLGTTSGDLRLDATLAGDGPFAVRTISGDVIVVGRAGFRVEAESITGDLSSDVPSKRESFPGRKVLTIGRAGPTLSFRSVSGDFHVAEPRDAGAATLASDVTAKVVEPAVAVAPRAALPPAGAAADDQATDAAASANPGQTQLDVLRALERGEITVAEATERLSQLDEVLR